MTDYAPDLIDYLEEAGCYFVRRGRGDHSIWFSPITKRNFTVDGTIRSRHTANHVLKEAGLGKKF